MHFSRIFKIISLSYKRAKTRFYGNIKLSDRVQLFVLMRVRLLNTVLLASDFEKLVNWYKKTLGLEIGHSVSDDYHYAELTRESEFVIAVADAKEMGVNPDTTRNNTAIPQLAVSDVNAVLNNVAVNGGKILFGPSYDEKGKFHYGGFKDTEGNQIWVAEDK